MHGEWVYKMLLTVLQIIIILLTVNNWLWHSYVVISLASN